MTIRERIALFPTSVRLLWKDWLLYRNIQDAARTPRNAWTIPREARQRLPLAGRIIRSHIPWRQREQRRRFLDGLSTVLPVVVIWALPIIGYVPMVLAVLMPRQLLSRHFHNEHEQFEYNRLAYRQLHERFATVQRELFRVSEQAKRAVDDWGRKERNRPVKLNGSGDDEDAAGPLLDHLLPLYRSAFASDSSPLSSVDRLPRRYLVQFALAAGVYQTLPPRWSGWLAAWTPSWWLRRRVRHAALAVEDDDQALLLQRGTGFGARHGAVVVGGLTALEVSDACLARGLPVVDVTPEQMRECLSHHLDMMASLEEQIVASLPREQPSGDGSCSARDGKDDEAAASRDHSPLVVNEEALGLFTLHLTILRDYLWRRRSPNESAPASASRP